VGTEEFDTEGLTRIGKVLLIELKRGGYRVGRDEANQASNYVEDLLSCGAIEGSPFIQAFVVGHEIDSRAQQARSVGESPVLGKIRLCTYSQLVRTAEQRLFNIKRQLASHYEDISGAELLKKVLEEPVQAELGPLQ
jgi:hypothetical protein